MAGDTTSLAAIVRLLAHPEVDGLQVLKEKPVVVGIRRAGKWTWFFKPTAALGLQQAERALQGLPLLEEKLP
jgi:hypothetical protein